MTLCVIGNSHVSAIKLGADSMDPTPDITYFASYSGSVGNLRVADDRLVPGSDRVRAAFELSSGGQTDIVIADYDAFAIIGLLAFRNTLNICRTHRLARHADRDVLQLVSDDTLRAAVYGSVRSSVSLQTVRRIRSISEEIPIVVVSSPLPNATIVDTDTDDGLWQNEPVLHDMRALYLDALDRVAQESDVRVVVQPPETVDRFFTREEFSRDSVFLLAGSKPRHVEDELFHMNREYGALVLGVVLNQLASV